MTLENLIRDPEIRESLQRIIAHEEKLVEKYRSDPMYEGLRDANPYWSLMDIPIEWSVARKLLFAGVIRKAAKKWYILVDREAVKKALKEYEEYRKIREGKIVEVVEKGLPPDLFDVVEGYNDLKEFLFMTLRAEEPVHCLLVGPPGTAKSLILMELERIGARFITAGTATKVGIRDVIYDELPRLLIIDEIDKISDSRDLASLLTWMESGRIIITKHGLRDERKGKGWVFAASNRLDRLPPELIDRFQVFHIKPYTPEQFVQVVIGYLTKRMNVPQELAKYIAEKVKEYSVRVREAIRVARLAKNKEDVDKFIRIVRRYM